jgi:FtsH-binding integral membrane protein
VYSLVTIQLLITAGIGYLGYNNQGFRQTFGSMPAFIIITVLLITLCIIISCCTDIFRRYALPIFVLFTALLSLLVAIGISAYKSESILAAVLITSVLVVGLTVYACIFLIF